ncbi:MAG: ABC transporter permease [Actinomycetia bacterium]|nr:ABC transporter permease [Actinomycetes bacterium]
MTVLLIKRTLRKRPGQALTIAVLTLLAAAMLHVGVILVTDYQGNVESKAAEWNSPTSLTVLTGGAPAQRMAEIVAADPAVEEVELIDSYTGMTTIALDEAQLTSLASIVDLSRAGELGPPDIVDVGPPVDDGIWAPAALHASGFYGLGDEIVLDTTQGTSTFRIAGFIEDLYGGAPGMGTLTFGLEHDEFVDFDAPGFSATATLKTTGDDVVLVSRAVDAALGDVQSTLGPGEWLSPLWGQDIATTKAAASMSSAIFVAMLVALALAILAIASVVTRFVLKNLIASDLPSIGTLRAAGFTTTQIMGALVATYAGLTAAGAVVGSALSYLLLPPMATSFQAQNGLSWDPRFSWLALGITVATMLIAVLLTATFAARRIRRTTTVGALRGGIATHSATRNHLPLATTSGRLSTLLGLKAGLRQYGQNVLLALTVAVVAFAAVSMLGMVENLLGDREKATELLVGTVEDVLIVPGRDADPQAILNGLHEADGVREAFFQSSFGLSVNGLSVGFLVTPEPDVHQLDPLAEGRLPRHDNEIAVGGRLASVESLRLGETYTIDLGTGPAEFAVTGITSSARNLGQMVLISSDGFRRISPGFEDTTIAVFTDDAAQVMGNVLAQFGTELESVTNQRENVEAQLSSYLTLVPIIGTFTIVFVLLVTVLVVGLVVSTMLVQTRREMGIKKAMGFTNGELSAQTRWTYLPALTIGALVGALAGTFALGPLLQLLLSQIGIRRVAVAADWVSTGGITLGIAGIGALVLWVASLRIGRISAYDLVTE